MEVGFGLTNGILLGFASGEHKGRYFHIYILFVIVTFEWE